MPHNPHTFAAAYLLLLQDGKILLARRYNTGFEDGKYSLPAGHTEPSESFTETLLREAQEEIGISLDKKTFRVSHTMHRKTPEREYVDVYYLAETWTGTPENREPEKCDDLSWFPVSDLPENIIPYVRQAIKNSLSNIPYSEFGWK